MYERDPETLWRRVGAGVVLLPPGAAAPLPLGAFAARVWQLLSSPTNARSIRDTLMVEGSLTGEAGTRELDRVLTLSSR
ncbi:MAG: hypothetical protein FD127_1868 [Acidimicrobiaceae bacterium]|nr:MAG: hypothetical protein FD127_1868 [Acidimicrobiaceae bacterium]